MKKNCKICLRVWFFFFFLAPLHNFYKTPFHCSSFICVPSYPGTCSSLIFFLILSSSLFPFFSNIRKECNKPFSSVFLCFFAKDLNRNALDYRDDLHDSLFSPLCNHCPFAVPLPISNIWISQERGYLEKHPGLFHSYPSYVFPRNLSFPFQQKR